MKGLEIQVIQFARFDRKMSLQQLGRLVYCVKMGSSQYPVGLQGQLSRSHEFKLGCVSFSTVLREISPVFLHFGVFAFKLRGHCV